MAEIKLSEDAKERRRNDEMADLYAIIKTIQHLETMYVRDVVAPDAYTEACQRLLAQYKTTEAAIRSDPSFPGTIQFIKDYSMDCPLAQERLSVGVPATVIHAHSDAKGKEASVIVAEATQFFITALDCLKLGSIAVDEVSPNITDLVRVLNKSDTIAPGFDKSKLQNWLVQLNNMRASDELDEDQVRQLVLDLESGYDSFKSSLSNF